MLRGLGRYENFPSSIPRNKYKQYAQGEPEPEKTCTNHQPSTISYINMMNSTKNCVQEKYEAEDHHDTDDDVDG